MVSSVDPAGRGVPRIPSTHLIKPGILSPGQQLLQDFLQTSLVLAEDLEALPEETRVQLGV